MAQWAHALSQVSQPDGSVHYVNSWGSWGDRSIRVPDPTGVTYGFRRDAVWQRAKQLQLNMALLHRQSGEAGRVALTVEHGFPTRYVLQWGPYRPMLAFSRLALPPLMAADS